MCVVCKINLYLKTRYHASNETKRITQPNYTNHIEINGEGFLAGMFKSIVEAFLPDSAQSTADAFLCLPNPTPPNYDDYTKILMLIFLCWTMAFFEPYGLRLRHVVLNAYYPDRARQRAVWLYNHILRFVFKVYLNTLRLHEIKLVILRNFIHVELCKRFF